MEGKGRREKKRERQKLPLQKKGRYKDGGHWRGRWEIHLSQQKQEVESESGRDLSLKGTGYPGDRPGQQITIFPSLSYNKKVGS